MTRRCTNSRVGVRPSSQLRRQTLRNPDESRPVVSWKEPANACNVRRWQRTRHALERLAATDRSTGFERAQHLAAFAAIEPAAGLVAPAT
jgi:hypothetical protein